VAATPEELVDGLVARGSVPGAALVVVDAGRQVIAERYAGSADREGTRPVGPGTRFALASLTKPLVALAALVAVEEGLAELDQPLAEHVPGAAPQLTLRNTLAHYSGLPEGVPTRTLGAGPIPTWDEARAAYAQVAPERGAGERRVYSNPGYVLAGLAVEHAAGMPFERYLDEAVLGPLGMGGTTLGLPAALDDEAAWVREPGLWAHGVALFNGAEWRRLPSAASAGFATAPDYARFLALVLAGGRLPDGRHLVAEETLAELTTNQGGALEGGVESFMTWPRADWGCGFELRDAKERHWTGDALSPQAATHFGASGTLAFADPGHGRAAVLLANRGTYSGWILEPGAWPDLCAAIVRP
jgi:CubicO group peptidase (beta-lactamase class C family)